MSECERTPPAEVGCTRGVALRAAALLGVALAVALPAAAHNLAPAYLELREQPGGAVAVLWKLPAVMPRGASLEPALPCPTATPPAAHVDGEAVLFEWRIACAGSLVGRHIAVEGLAGSGTDAILSVGLADGRHVRAILTASAPSLTVPARESTLAVLTSYARLGVEHLWTGLDHLLFVAGLSLLLGATRRLVVAITAFTAGHSVTLALATLGFVQAPQAAVEVAIAATIVALALSLARAPVRGGDAPAASIARRPALLPFAFGLLHGLGFAGALAELGLPQHAIPLALFSFNLGIELGQLGVVAALLVLAFFTLRAREVATPQVASLAREAATTAIGAMGVFWCLDRASSWLFP